MTSQNAAVQASTPTPGQKSAAETLARARSDDLVVALVGHIGAGLDDVRARLKEEFRLAEYQPTIIKVSDDIADLAKMMGFPDAQNLWATRRIDQVIARQGAGTWLRRKVNDDITASLAVRAIRKARHAARGLRRRIEASLHHRFFEAPSGSPTASPSVR